MTMEEIEAGTIEVRKFLDLAGRLYSSQVSDAQCQQVAIAVLTAASKVREGTKP